MYHFSARIFFVVGIIFGIILSIILNFSNVRTFKKHNLYDLWFSKLSATKTRMTVDAMRYGHLNFISESKYLYENIRVLCVILSTKAENTEACKITWGLNCNDIKSINLQKNYTHSIKKIRERRRSTWKVFCEEFLDIPLYDWVLFVSDTTFVIMENLRYYVAPMNKDERLYLGHAINFWNTDYNTVRAGFLINKRSLLSIKQKLNDDATCNSSSTYVNLEDYYLGKV